MKRSEDFRQAYGLEEINNMLRDELIYYIQTNAIPISDNLIPDTDTEDLRGIAIEHFKLKEY